MRTSAVLLTLALSAYALAAPPTMDGSAIDILYGSVITVQDTQTGFGDANLGRPDVCNGSELDGAFGVVYGGNLYLVLAGNFETNGNKLELFFDTRAGGQNQLLATNPGTPGTGLLRMSADPADPNYPGLKFASGFLADFWVSVNCYGDPTLLYVDYAELYVNSGNPGVLYYCGAGQPKCTTVGGALTGGDPNAPAILCTVDNSNVLGVTGGFGAGDGSDVVTGIELAIPLAALGNPTGDIYITAFINGQQHDFVSNQVLGGLAASTSDNLGEPRLVDFSAIGFGVQQPFSVPLTTTPRGACCNGATCTIKTAAQCASGGGVYQGDNTNCDGNPCDATPQGRCCIDDGYSGQCLIRTQAQCNSLGGTWGGGGTTCDGCPCLLDPTGACCVGTTCDIRTENDCNAAGGLYVGNYTNCGSAPCDAGACCTGLDCDDTLKRFQCTGPSTRFVAGATCASNPCAEPTIPTPYLAGDFNGWNAGDPNYVMPETAPGSRIFTKLVTGLTAGSRHEYKITNGTWDLNRPQSGNAWFFADGNGEALVTYDANFYADGWLPVRDRLPLPAYSDPGAWTAVGDWQGWNNSNAATAMTAQGGGVYKYTGTGVSAGTHYGKAVRTSSWDAIGADNRSVNADNIEFVVGDPTDTLEITVDAINCRIKIVVTPAGPEICYGDLNCDGQIDFGDINPFVKYVSDNAGWQATYPGCPVENGDIDGDGQHAGNGALFDDINAFVGLLGSAPLPIPCP